MRLQPPKNQKRFLGKQVNDEIIMSYIGEHQVLGLPQETTFDEYVNLTPLQEKEITTMLGLFPNEIKDLALIYLKKKLTGERIDG